MAALDRFRRLDGVKRARHISRPCLKGVTILRWNPQHLTNDQHR
jgi:hypothetical protein